MRREALPLAAVVAVAAGAGAWFSLQLVEFFVMPDEMTYAKGAVEAWAQKRFLLPGDAYFNSWSQLHLLLLAPAYGLFSTPTAFDVVHVGNAIVIASTAVPVYLLTRAVVEWRPAALLAAACSVALPWVAMAGTLMTEAFAYPAFAWALLAMTRAVARPGARADALALAAIGVAFLARTQLALLGVCFIAAILVHPRGLRGHWLVGVVAVVALAVMAIGGSDTLLGNYDNTASGDLLPPGTLDAARELTTNVVVAVGLLPAPVALAWAATTIAAREQGDARAFAVVGTIVAVVFAVAAGAFTIRFAGGSLNDRYLFYIAPILFAGCAAGLLHPRRGFAAAVVVAAAGTAWLVTGDALANALPSLVGVSQAFHQVLNGRSCELGTQLGQGCIDARDTLPVALIVAAVAVALLPLAWKRLDRRILAGAGLGLVLVYCAGQTAYTLDKLADTQAGAGEDFVANRDWIDREVDAPRDAAAVLAFFDSDLDTTLRWWDAAFWNKSIAQPFALPDAGGLQQSVVETLAIDAASGRVPALDRFRFVVRGASDARLGLRGERPLAERYGLSVREAERPYRARWHLKGAQPNLSGIPAGESGTLRVWDSRTVELTLRAHAEGAVPWSVEHAGRERTGRLRAGGEATVRMPLASAAAVLVLRAGGRSPADATQPALQVTAVKAG